MKKVLLLLLLFTIPAFLVLTKPGFFPSHDGEWMVIRLSAFHQSLKDGQFPVRWSSRLNHGYGYPVFNFLYPLPFYFGELFYFLSGSFSQAIKLIFLLSFPASTLTMYIWLKQKYSWWASFAGALLYVYTPYRFVDTYVRGSVGESLGFVFVPLIFLSVDLMPKKPYWATILGALAIAATILSHNVFIIFVALAGMYALLTLPKKHWLQTIWLFTIGLALSAYFLFPALLELKHVYASKLAVANPTDYLLTLSHVLIPSWGYGPSDPHTKASMSFQLGLANIAAVIAAFITFRKKRTSRVSLFLLSFIVSLLLTLSISFVIWKIIPGIAVIQFPWRLLAVTTFTSSALLATLTHKHRWLGVIALFALITNLPYAKPQQTTHIPDEVYATNEDTTTVRQEYTPLWVTNFPTQRTGERITFTQGRGFVTGITETNRSFDAKIEASEDSIVKFARIYYPGWIAVANGRPTAIDYSQNGLMQVALAKGVTLISLRWQETSLRTLFNYLSLLTLLGMISHVACTLFWSQAPAQSQPKKQLK